ncbi:MAG: DUF6350 family protein [Actinomycetota bacterium]
MKCPHCGADNPDGTTHCGTCGRDVTATAEQPFQAAAKAPAEPRKSPLSGGWQLATNWGAIVFIIMVLLGQALAFLSYYSVPERSGVEIGTVVKAGALYLSAFHHAGITLDLSFLGQSITASMSFALLAVTALLAHSMYRGGKAVAKEVGGDALARGVHGMKVAPAYSLLSLAVAIVLGISPIRFEQGSVRASYIGAFLWPLLIAGVAGFAGGVMSAKEELDAKGTTWRRAITVIVGAWRMLMAGLVLSVVALLVVSAVRPDDRQVAFPSVSAFGEDGGLVLLVHNVLFLPNEAVWTLVPAMGACDSVDAGLVTIDFLCYQHFPGQEGGETPAAGLIPGADLPSLGRAPAGYFLFLLVPLLATVWAGRWVGRRARERKEAAALGAATGVAFSILVGIAAVLAGISVSASGQAAMVAGGSASIGPELVNGMLFALLWGVAGGVLGALIGGKMEASEASRAAPRA